LKKGFSPKESLKRLASVVQLRPWPPSFQSLYLTFEQEFSVRSQSASVRGMAENGNQHCPLDAITLYFTNNVIHLPSEY
jgi:hypothetical protein